jgi:hypothetical protein
MQNNGIHRASFACFEQCFEIVTIGVFNNRFAFGIELKRIGRNAKTNRKRDTQIAINVDLIAF